MRTRSIVILLAVAVALITLFYSFSGSLDQSAYVDQIKEEREDKDRFMRTSKESPFSDTTQKYQGLKYFPPDVKYKITASLVPIKDKKPIMLGTNDGKEQRYLEYAYAEFDLDGYHNQLLILETMEAGEFRGKLFLAFGDETSAVDTYGAGRYLDITKAPGSNSITLDFNLSYNPYCAYVEKYSCPFPPGQNLLHVAINAGEKVYHE
ncbi:MAG: DUF1684 domain-containing protein [Chryseolinea sp.]